MGLSSKRRIGLFGGSFNPIHVGHVALARQLKELAQLDEVWLMVSPQNPLKQKADLLCDELRLLMAQRALEQEDGIRACDYEMHLPKPSYTWNTLEHLSQDYPDVEFVLLIGGDNWELFTKWYRWQDILHNYHIVVYPRPGSDIDTTALPPHVRVVNTPLMDISSTQVRQRVRHHEPVTGMVPQAIEPLVLRYYAQP